MPKILLRFLFGEKKREASRRNKRNLRQICIYNSDLLKAKLTELVRRKETDQSMVLGVGVPGLSIVCFVFSQQCTVDPEQLGLWEIWKQNFRCRNYLEVCHPFYRTKRTKKSGNLFMFVHLIWSQNLCFLIRCSFLEWPWDSGGQERWLAIIFIVNIGYL